MDNHTTYTISEVADLIGVSTKTLRRWEDRGIVDPIRTLGNQRRYTNEHVAILQKHASQPSSLSTLIPASGTTPHLD